MNYKIYYLLKSLFEEMDFNERNSNFLYLDNKFIDNNLKNEIKIDKDRLYLDIYDYINKNYNLENKWGILQGVRPLKILYDEKCKNLTDKEIISYLYDKYRVDEDISKLLLYIRQNQKEYINKDLDKYSLYISIPFCPSICSYCNFHTELYNKTIASEYLKIILNQIDIINSYTKEIDCVYIGGGTPSIYNSNEIEKLLYKIRNLFPKIKELSFEAGRVDSLNLDKSKIIAKYSDNISINPQSFNKKILKDINRYKIDNFKEIIDFFKSKSTSINSDLIVGFDNQDEKCVVNDINRLINYSVDKISIHNLSVKKGSKIWNIKNENKNIQSTLFSGYRYLEDNRYKPYYIYRQKNMIGFGQNISFTKNTPTIYNIRMMENNHKVIAIGSNSVSKKYINGQVKRYTTYRNIRKYIKDSSKMEEILFSYFKE